MERMHGKETEIDALLGKLKAICDRGFALAVHIRYTRPTLLYQTYAQDWSDHYSEKGYMLSDPTVHWGLANVGSMDWDMQVDQDPEGVIKAARNYGLINGWTYAVGPATSRSLASMTKTTPFTEEQRNQVRAAIDEIHALTDGFENFPPKQQIALRALI
ncbi:MAG: autoinducer binding domain-containing protein [Paracoccaceae bacterium]